MLFARALPGERSDSGVNLDWGLNCRSPRLFQLRDYWRGKAKDGRLPARSDIRPDEIASLLPDLILVDVKYDPFRLRYRLIGTNIVQTMARDSTGKYYDEVYEGALLERIHSSFLQLIERRVPLRTFGEAFYPDKKIYSYETINLPLARDGETVDMVLGLIAFHFGPPA